MSDTTKTADQEKDLDWREATRGKELRLTTENRELGTIIAGKPGRVAEDDNWVYHSAEFRLADGTRCFGAVLLCECDQGEHWETIIFLPGSDAVTAQEDTDFLERLGKKEWEVFPYRYRYLDWKTSSFHDAHRGADGWCH